MTIPIHVLSFGIQTKKRTIICIFMRVIFHQESQKHLSDYLLNLLYGVKTCAP